MPDITAMTLAKLTAGGYRYVRFNGEGTLQACKHSGDTGMKKEWENIETSEGASYMRLPHHTELDLDSF